MKVDKYPIPTKCIHCGGDVVYTSNSEIYGKEYGNGKCYLCITCRSYVGVHDGTDIPLGILATEELRELKKKAHNLFDPIWKSKKKYRWQCYQQLALKLEIPHEECHFGWFDKDRLLKAIDLLEQGLFDIVEKPKFPVYVDYTGKSFKCITDKYGCYTNNKLYPIRVKGVSTKGVPVDFAIVDDDGDDMPIFFCLKRKTKFELID